MPDLTTAHILYSAINKSFTNHVLIASPCNYYYYHPHATIIIQEHTNKIKATYTAHEELLMWLEQHIY